MKKIIFLLSLIFTMNLFAMGDLATGDYGVSVTDRRGKVHHCTLNIKNVKEETGDEYLVLNISDCPPPVVDITLFKYESDNLYQSDKIHVTTRRGGYKIYIIRPLSDTHFEMESFREYGDGGVAKPRKVIATLK